MENEGSNQRRAALGAIAVVIVVALTGSLVRHIARNGRRQPNLMPLADAVGDVRLMQARMTGGFGYGPLPSLARAAKPLTENLSFLTVAGQAQKNARSHSTAANLHAWGAAQTLLGDYNAAVQTLSAAAAAAPADPEIQSDLAAAYLTRASALDRRDDWPRALAVAERALAVDPRQSEALFNRALALDAMNLRERARAAWHAYLDADSASGWAEEARHAVQRARDGRLAGWDGAVAQFRRGETTADALVTLSRQSTRELGEQVVLGEWARAVQSDDAKAAAASFAQAGALGNALRAAGGDTVLDDHVEYLEGRGAARRSDIARAQMRWAAALEQITAYRYAEAVPILDEAAGRMRAAGAPLAVRIEAQLASAARAARRFDIVRRAPPAALPDRGCSLARAERARAIGLLHVAEANYDRALAEYEAAAGTYGECGETGNQAAVFALTAELLTVLGAYERAWRYELSALAQLADVSQTRGRLLITYCGSELALRQGLPEAAVHFSRESADIARAAGHWPGYAEATANVAKGLMALGRLDDADAEVAAALQHLRNIGNDRHRQFVEGELLIALARVRSQRDPRNSRDIVDRALRHAESAQRSAHLPGLLLARSRTAAAGGDLNHARADLRDGIKRYLDQLQAAGDSWLRLSFRHAGWELYEYAAWLELESGAGSTPALELLLEGQARVSMRGGSASHVSLREMQSVLPAGAVAVFVHAFQDRLVTWAIGRTAVAFHATPIKWLDVRTLQQQLTAALERGDERKARELSERAYRLTLLPHEQILATSDRLHIVSTAPLDQLAWSSLRSSDGTFLVESKAISLATVGVVTMHAVAPDAHTLVLAAPDAGDGAIRLTRVQDEANAILSIRRGAKVVDASAVSRADVMEALRGVQVLHYAGHAFADAEIPERSALVFRSGDSTRRLTARELAALPLRAELAILTACQTAADPAARSAGSASLAAVLRHAGVKIVVASVGDVNDDTAHALGVEIHRQLALGHDAATALRLSQLARSKATNDPRWALFVVFS